MADSAACLHPLLEHVARCARRCGRPRGGCATPSCRCRPAPRGTRPRCAPGRCRRASTSRGSTVIGRSVFARSVRHGTSEVARFLLDAARVGQDHRGAGLRARCWLLRSPRARRNWSRAPRALSPCLLAGRPPERPDSRARVRGCAGKHAAAGRPRIRTRGSPGSRASTSGSSTFDGRWSVTSPYPPRGRARRRRHGVIASIFGRTHVPSVSIITLPTSRMARSGRALARAGSPPPGSAPTSAAGR